MSNIANIRKDYQLLSFSETDALADPFAQFEVWWNEAIKAQIDEVNAMTLATASADGVPSARIVLLKEFDRNGFSFFTHYESHKGKQLTENPRACLVFFWKELQRQVRITGLVDKLEHELSDKYFDSRPDGSKISAWASPQSQVIRDRNWLDENTALVKEQFNGKIIGRPSYWGGYCVRPVTIEFWQGRASRLHDRLQYTIQPDGNWLVERLAP